MDLHSPTGKPRGREFLWVLLLACGATMGLVVLLEPPAATLQWDRPVDFHKYHWMAERPFTLHTAPFCYRILVPLLVWALPVDPLRGFVLVSALSLIVLQVAVYSVARFTGCGPLASLAGLLTVVGTGPVTHGALSGYPSVDPPVWCMVAFSYLLRRSFKGNRSRFGRLAGRSRQGIDAVCVRTLLWL